MVTELMAASREASTAWWRFRFDPDLMSVAEANPRALDDPLPWMLLDPRRLRRTMRDGVWLRAVDAAAALEQRSYAEAGRLTLEVSDGFCSWNDGRFELEGGPEGAASRATNSSPDLTIDVSDPASAYLGTASLTYLASAGPGGRAYAGGAGPRRPDVCRTAAAVDPVQLLAAVAQG